MTIRALECPRRGTTLVELLVVLALLGVLYSVVHLAMPREAPRTNELTRIVLDARREATLGRHAVSRSWEERGHRIHVTAYPGGLVLADSGRGTFVARPEVPDDQR